LLAPTAATAAGSPKPLDVSREEMFYLYLGDSGNPQR
jgi:hypothetical protein